MTWTADDLYALLPAVHRVRDAELGGPLHELLSVVADEAAALAESLEQSYDDQFVETAAEWVLPYLGDLVGYRLLGGSDPAVVSPRADVADTIRARRRKGTAPMVEQVARNVTGWPARVVEMFELLTTTQYLNHLRPHARAVASLRDATALEHVGGPFEQLCRTAEVRSPANRGGRWNIPAVAVFLWRVQARRVVRAPLVDADGAGLRYRVDPLGVDRQLVAVPRTEEEVTHLAEPADVPLPLTRRGLAARLGETYGPGRSLLLETADAAAEGTPLVTGQVRVCDLSDDPAVPGQWAHQPGAGEPVAIDPVLGRVAFPEPPDLDSRRLVTYAYGTALAVGGGGYDRADSTASLTAVAPVTEGTDLQPLLDAAAAGGGVRIGDSAHYAQTPVLRAATPVEGAADRTVVLAAAPGTRPLLAAAGPVRLELEPSSTLVLEGLLVAGGPLVLEEQGDNAVRRVVLRHCTLVPGLTRDADNTPGSPDAASLLVLDPFAVVELDHCVLGPVVAVQGATVRATSCVLDASARDGVAVCGRPEPAGGGLRTVAAAADGLVGDGLEPGGHLRLDECTVLGRVHVERLDCSNSLLLAALPEPPDGWVAPVWAERRQQGCARFSWLPPGSRTPQRYRCLPDDVHPDVHPQHTSLRWGDHGYGQLHAATAEAIRAGADDGGEIGVTYELHQTQREANLRVRLEEYLRFGLEAGVFHAT